MSWVFHGVCAPSEIGTLPALLSFSQTASSSLQVVGMVTPTSLKTFLL
jgi:hypothetical protein